MIHAVMSGSGRPNPVTFLGEEAQDLLPLMHMMNANNSPPTAGRRVCLGKKYTHQTNAAAIARMNAKTSNLFGVYFNGVIQEMALTPQVPVYFALMRHFENLAQRISKDNGAFMKDEEKAKLLDIALTAVKIILGEMTELPRLKEKEDALAAPAIQTILKKCQTGLKDPQNILNAMCSYIERGVQTSHYRQDFAQRLIASKTKVINKLREGIKYLQLLLETDADWQLLLQPCSQICEMTSEEPVPAQFALHHLEALTDQLNAACSKMNSESVREMLQINPAATSLIRKYQEKLEHFKELITSSKGKQNGLEAVSQMEIYFQEELLSFEKLAKSFPGDARSLRKIFIIFGAVDGWEALRQFLGRLHMQRRLAQLPPLQMAKILPLHEVVRDLEEIFPVMQERNNFEQFFLTLQDGSFAKLLDAKTKYALDQFLLTAFTTIYQETTDQLHAVISEWGEDFLAELLQEMQKLHKGKCSSMQLFEMTDKLQQEVIGKLEVIVDNFVKKHATIKAELEKLKGQVAIDLTPIEQKLEELHFFITCSLNGPKEMLKECLSQFLEPKTMPAPAGKKMGKRKACKKAAPVSGELNPDAGAAKPVASLPNPATVESKLEPAVPKPIIAEPSPATVESKFDPVVPKPTIAEPKPASAPTSPEPGPKPVAAAASSSISKEQGPDLSSEKSRKLRNFLDLVKKYGYYLARRSGGSHFAYRHRESNNTISIPQHDVLRLGTARAIIDEILTAQKKSN